MVTLLFFLFPYVVNNSPGIYVQSEAKSNADVDKKYMQFDVNSLQNPVFVIENMDCDITSYQLRDTVVDVLTISQWPKKRGKPIMKPLPISSWRRIRVFTQ